MTKGNQREALAVLLVFDCYLRAADLDKLIMKRILIDHDQSGPQKGCLRARITLNVTKRGKNQTVLVKRPFIRHLLADLRETIDEKEYFLTIGVGQMRRLIRKALAEMNLSRLKINPLLAVW